MPRILVVGAGAVGQVFALHLASGGASVTFLVKDKHAEECRRGFVLYPLNQRRHPATELACSVITTMAEVAEERWDQVYLAMSSTALRAGAWLAELARATGDATIVMLQPGLDDHRIVAECVGAERLVHGVIGFLSYHAPMPGETRFPGPGMAYWLFPGTSPFSGTDARVRAVIDALVAGKLPARRARDVQREAAFPSAMLAMFVAALEAAGWSFRTMRKAGLAALGGRAAGQAIRVVASELGGAAPLAMRLAARPLVFRAILRLAPRVVPVDLEAYMKLHFTKVGDQMHEGVRTYLERGRRASLEVGAIEELARRLVAGTP